MADEIFTIQSSTDIRREQHTKSLQQEVEFWRQKSEDLQYTLEKIFDVATRDGSVIIYFQHRHIDLHVAPKLDSSDAS